MSIPRGASVRSARRKHGRSCSHPVERRLPIIMLAVLSVLVASAAWVPVEAATALGVDSAVAAPASGTEITLGGDVSTLGGPAPLGATQVLGTGWRTFNVTASSAVPREGVAAVVLDGVVAKARRGGSLYTRPLGSTTGGAPLLEFGTSGGRGISVVKLGRDGAIQVRSSAGTPTASVRVVAWLPETTSFRVGEGPAQTSARVGTGTRTLALPGVPATAASVLVQLTRTARGSGTLHSWAAGDAQPKQGLAFGKGTTSVVDVVPVAKGRAIRLRSSRGQVNVVVRVLAWAPSDSSLTAVSDQLLASIKSGPKRVVKIAAVGGVPSNAQHVWASLTAPSGARVQVWDNPTGSGSPVHDWRANGSATSLLLPVPRGQKVAMRVTGTKVRTSLVAHGFDLDRAKQELVLAPRVGTHLLGWGDVESFLGSQLVLARTSDPVAPGDHLQVRGNDGLPYTLRAVTTGSAGSGRQSVEVEPATLSDAFADFRFSYGSKTGPTPRLAASARSAGLGGSLGASLGLGNWSCSGGGSAPAFDIDFTGDPYLDVNLKAGTFDFSLKGQLVTTTEWSGSNTVSCSYEGEFAQIPLGTSPVAIKLGPTATLTIDPHGEQATVSTTSTQRLYASIYYDGGKPVVGKALHADASSNTVLGPGTAQLDLGVKVALGPASHGEFEIGPEVAATLGASYVLAPPDPADDPHSRRLAGPRCSDLTNTLFLSFGAALLVPFLPDVSLDIARFDTDPAVLYRGPCVGYEGTITYRGQGSYYEDALSCTEVPDPCYDWNHTVTKTLVPGMASFGTWVMQPYSWKWTGRDRSFVKNWSGDGRWNPLCTTASDYSGNGAVGWDTEADHPSPEGWPTPSIFSNVGSDMQVQAEMAVGHGRGRQVTTVTDHDPGDGYPCDEGSSGEAQIPGAVMTTEGNGGAEIWRKTIALVARDGSTPSRVNTATFNLTRREYARN